MGPRVGQEQDVLSNKIGLHHFDLAGPVYKGENAHSAYIITFPGGLLHPINSQEVHRRLTGQLSHQVRSLKLERLDLTGSNYGPQLAQSALSSKPAHRQAEVQYFLVLALN